MLLLCYFHFFLTDEGFLKKFIDSTKSLSPDEKGERLESDEVWDFLSLVKGNHFGHRCGKQMFCHTLLPFKQIFIVMLLSFQFQRPIIFYFITEHLWSACSLCSGRTNRGRDMTIEGSCAWILKNGLKYELQQIFALVITLWQESIAI